MKSGDSLRPSQPSDINDPLPRSVPVALEQPTAQATPGEPRQRRPKKQQICRFYPTKRGCRAGAACPFLHEAAEESAGQTLLDGDEPVQELTANATNSTETQISPQDLSRGNVKASVEQSKHQEVPSKPVRKVQRPVSTVEVQDPRKFQINQIKTRFSAREDTVADGGVVLHFKMLPSDPDFPFEIEALECTLRIPLGFPREQTPSMRVTNKEMERGYQINVERGFDAIWAQLANPTLLIAMKALDRRLEELLTARKADTIKLVANAGPVINRSVAAKVETQVECQAAAPSITPPSKPTEAPISTQRRNEAELKRQEETGILEHRLGRHPQFSSAAGGTIYTVPVEPRKRNELPISIQAVKAVRLFVPKMYDLEPCSIELIGVEGDVASSVESAFTCRAVQHPELTLLAHINFLAQNMHIMATEKPVDPLKAHSPNTPDVASLQITEPPVSTQSDEGQSHIIMIPRPPEWASKFGAGHEDSSDDDSIYSTSEDESAEEAAEAMPESTAETSSTPREKGVLVSFPHMELYSIELLELTSPNITVKCERCKDTMDIPRLQNNEKGDNAGIRSESCKKCAFSFGVGYRKDLMHVNSIRAGYLDLDGCTVVDLLPSNFTPTCSECSTPYPSPGVVAVRGDSSMAICRECHHKMTFRIPEVKFLLVGSGLGHASQGLPRKKPKENLGIVAGQELPRRGRCAHYGKSYRWFRFSCCSKVFPCDKCHDEASDHPNEWANRMICGICSREQNYRPEDCGICHSPLTGKTGSGFWEGGKGTRDKVRMSRKDPRKYKRRGVTTAAKSK